MKDRSMYFKEALSSCNNQFYTHQEIKICGRQPLRDTDYDYLILSYANNPKNVCDCKTDLVWKGFDDFISEGKKAPFIYIWKVLK